MSRMLTASECAAWLLAHDDYLIISHRRPDGDTLGSGAALCSALRRAGRRARCFDNPETISLHRPFVEPYVSGDGGDYSTLVTVDVASEGLFPDGVTGPVPLAIDHHPSNSGYAARTLLREKRAACGEIVLDKLLIEQILRENPGVQVTYGVRGGPVINDVTIDDAEQAGIMGVARVLSSGVATPTTVISASTEEFRRAFFDADLVISKGMGNFEVLVDGCGREDVYFLLMTKCTLVTDLVGVPLMSFVCKRG